MKVGVLETGAPPAGLQAAFGRYPTMFQALLAGEDYDWRIYDVRRGRFPARPEDCAAYIVTGSAAGVYDPEPWIGEAEAFLRSAKGKAALVGVCFGHQLMAQAFGGKVIKSEKGWGIGRHEYSVREKRPWIDGEVASAPASHQDQVVEIPPGARIVAGSEFTPFGMLAWDDQPAISVQLHPEFAPAYAKALIVARGDDGRYAPGQAEAALASLDLADQRGRLAGWIKAFLAQARL
ncbi:MAG: glutamine amidotransferase-related protein [Caulobacteraceae bacterium]